MSEVRVAIVHGWARGNVGDTAMLSVLIDAIRPIASSISYRGCKGFEGAAFTHKLDEWQECELDEMLRGLECDVLMFHPGGGIQNARDHRARHILRDCQISYERGIKTIFSCHSVAREYAPLVRGHFFAREEVSFDLIRNEAATAHLSSDLAYLHKLPAPRQGDKKLLFLRFDNFSTIDRHKDILVLSNGSDDFRINIADCYLSSSDPDRDNLQALSKRTGIEAAPVASLLDLLDLIAGCSGVISDRYHPALFAQRLRKEVVYLGRNVRDRGFMANLKKPVIELERMADNALQQIVSIVAE